MLPELKANRLHGDGILQFTQQRLLEACGHQRWTLPLQSQYCSALKQLKEDQCRGGTALENANVNTGSGEALF